MTTGFVDLALAATMTLFAVSIWPGIMSGSVFCSSGFTGVNSVSLAIKKGD